MKIPSTIVQGDTVSWIDTAAADNLGNPITSALWTLIWYFNGPSKFNVVATSSADGWQTTLTAAQTTAMTAIANTSDRANYYWQATATYSGQSVTLGTGTLTITPNLSTLAVGYDGRTQAETDLTNVEAAIRARISGGGISEYYIGTRRLKYEGINELRSLRSELKLIVSKERTAQSIANGLGDPRTSFVRFS
jgi:hypothetical protein